MDGRALLGRVGGRWSSKVLILLDLVGSRAANTVALKQLVGHIFDTPLEEEDSSIMSGV